MGQKVFKMGIKTQDRGIRIAIDVRFKPPLCILDILTPLSSVEEHLL
jgi:hypothetical protein